MRSGDAVTQGAERRPVEPPDGGAAWLALYEGEAPGIEPIEDNKADVERAEAPRAA